MCGYPETRVQTSTAEITYFHFIGYLKPEYSNIKKSGRIA